MVDTLAAAEARRRELQLAVNSFDNPTELSGIQAWSQLMLHLIFLRPGTYPTLPEMGVDIESYQYDFIDEAVPALISAITRQQQTYLPDIPLSEVTVVPQTIQGEVVLFIALTFDTASGQARSAIAINASPTSRHFLDFDVSW